MTEPDYFEEGLNVFIGLGDGGIAKLEAALERARREGIEDQVLPIAINSRSVTNDDSAVKTIQLQKPEQQHLASDKKNRRYLDCDDKIAQLLAASREPRIGRYYVDTPENIGEIEGSIWEFMHSFIEGFTSRPTVDPDSVNVFLMSAAGGGTGNGTTPIIAGMIDAITDELNRKLGVNFQLFGLVTVSTLDSFNRGGNIPDVNLDYLTNTWALLEQLRALDGANGTDFPIRIPLAAANEGAGIRRDCYEFESNPFDAVYLLRFAEDNDDEGDTYERGVNETAAAVIHYWMRQDPDGEGVENEIDDLDHTFYEVRAATLETPVDTIDDLFDVEREIDELRAEIASHERQKERYETALTQLSQARSLHTSLDAEQPESHDDAAADDTAADAQAEVDGGVQTPVQTVCDRCRHTVENVKLDRLNDDVLDERTATLQSQLSAKLHDLVPGDAVVSLVFYTTLIDRLARERGGHSFPELVEQIASENRDAVQAFDPTFEGSGPALVLWREYIRPFLVDQRESLEAQIDNTNRFFDRAQRKDLVRQRDQVDDQIERLDQLAAEYERINGRIETVRDRLDSAQESVTVRQSELEEEYDEVAEAIRGVEVELNAAKKRRETLHEELTYEQLGRYVTLPVIDPSQLNPDRFDDPTIAELIEAGVIDEERVANLVTSMLDRNNNRLLKDRLMTRGERRAGSRIRGSRAPADATPVMLVSEENTPYLWDGAEGDDNVHEFARAVIGDPETVHQRDASRATILTFYGGLDFENFEHARLQETAERGEPTLLDVTVDLGNSIAYPELLPDDHPAMDD